MKRIKNIIMYVLCIAFILTNVTGAQQNQAKCQEIDKEMHILEGVLKICPKYLYRYYLSTGYVGGQTCALYGDNEFRDKIKKIKPGSWIHVEGRLSTRFHAGSTKNNLSPFPQTWIICMYVDKLKVMKGPRGDSSDLGVKSLSDKLEKNNMEMTLRNKHLDSTIKSENDPESVRGRETLSFAMTEGAF